MNFQEKEEIERIIALFPPKGSAIEQKKLYNAQVREELARTSNNTISFLAIAVGHQLSLRELKQRLRRQQFRKIEELFELLSLLFETRNTTSINRLVQISVEEIKRIAPLAKEEEIIRVVKKVVGTRMEWAIENAIILNPKKEEIIKKIENIKKGASDTSGIIRRVQNREITY